MNIKKILLATSALTSIYTQAAYYAVVNVPVAIGGSDEPQILVTKDSPEATTGTYKVLNAQLLTTNTVTSDDGCDVELSGDEFNGSFTYINNGCSQDDSFTLLGTKGALKTVKMWNIYNCDFTKNEWLKAAYDGIDGLVFNARSCNVDGSKIRYLMSYDSIPATYLSEVNINYNGHEGGSGELPEGGSGELPEGGAEPGIGEGATDPVFILPNIQVIYGDVVVDNPFLKEIDMSNLYYITGTKIKLNPNAEEIAFPNLRNLYGIPFDVEFLGAMSLRKIKMPNVRYLGTLDIRYTFLTDLRNLGNLREAQIKVGPTDFFGYVPIIDFPDRYSHFCYGVRTSKIQFDEAQSQENAVEACSL
ncbi:hypothetical protein [Vibrio penaeicida]|uniref:hypothetical protein n=1 Tax=Vibrio penaeicida TaxID=104609 RepID=UPI001CC813BA|nr:hypothetical protein [Vibrio penaeicida]